MKIIYLIRHGESEGNANHVVQKEDSPLSGLGQKQAEQIAKRVQQLPAEVIITSPAARAKETALLIKSSHDLPLEESPLLVECRHPSEQYGLPKDELYHQVRNTIRDNFGKPDWYYSDEESYFDLMKRSRAVLHYLQDRPESHLIVVTHGMFMRMLIAVIIHGEQVTPSIVRSYQDHLLTNNTGIALVQCDDSHTPPVWALRVWNDHAHLG